MGGTPVGRNYLVILHRGITAIDWGDGLFQDAVSGDYFKASEQDVSHRAADADLDWLIHLGRVVDYDVNTVTFIGLTELPSRTRH